MNAREDIDAINAAIASTNLKEVAARWRRSGAVITTVNADLIRAEMRVEIVKHLIEVQKLSTEDAYRLALKIAVAEHYFEKGRLAIAPSWAFDGNSTPCGEWHRIDSGGRN